MNMKLLAIVAGLIAFGVAGTVAADPIIISLNCTATLTAGAFAVVEAAIANPPELLVAPGAMIDFVNNILGTLGGCVSGPVPIPTLPPLPPLPP